MDGPGFLLAALGVSLGSVMISVAIDNANDRDCKRKNREEERKNEPPSRLEKYDRNSHQEVTVPQRCRPIELERVREVRGRNLVGKQAARLAALQAHAQTIQSTTQQTQQIPVLDAHEAFTLWITSAVTVTNNEYDKIKSMNLIMSYVKYCELNGFQQLDPNIFLEGMVMHSNSMGYFLVESEDGWVLVHGVLNES